MFSRIRAAIRKGLSPDGAPKLHTFLKMLHSFLIFLRAFLKMLHTFLIFLRAILKMLHSFLILLHTFLKMLRAFLILLRAFSLRRMSISVPLVTSLGRPCRVRALRGGFSGRVDTPPSRGGSSAGFGRRTLSRCGVFTFAGECRPAPARRVPSPTRRLPTPAAGSSPRAPDS